LFCGGWLWIILLAFVVLSFSFFVDAVASKL